MYISIIQHQWVIFHKFYYLKKLDYSTPKYEVMKGRTDLHESNLTNQDGDFKFSKKLLCRNWRSQCLVAGNLPNTLAAPRSRINTSRAADWWAPAALTSPRPMGSLYVCGPAHHTAELLCRAAAGLMAYRWTLHLATTSQPPFSSLHTANSRELNLHSRRFLMCLNEFSFESQCSSGVSSDVSRHKCFSL